MQKQIDWSTKTVDELVDKINQGFGAIGRDNPFFEINKYGTSIRKPNLVFKYQDAELIEYAKCRQDILHFASTYCKIKDEDSNIKPIILRDYQKKVLSNLKEERFNILLQSRQTGKCVHPNTLITITDGESEWNVPIIELWYYLQPKKTVLGYIRVLLYRLLRKL